MNNFKESEKTKKIVEGSKKGFTTIGSKLKLGFSKIFKKNG